MSRDDRNELAAQSMDAVVKDARVAADAVFRSARESAGPVVRESADASRAVFEGLALIRKL